MNHSVNEFTWPVRVYYEDTDAGGVVYNANYLNFMERARTEWLRALGFEQDVMIAQQDVLFAVRSIEIEFLKPARFNDELRVSVGLEKRGHASMTMLQEIWREQEPEMVLCQARVRIASLQASTLTPRAIPTEITGKLNRVS